MAYRKLVADSLFTGHKMLGSDAVLVLSETGIVEDIITSSEAGSDIEKYPGILSPGFINCHCHLELSHMKAVIAPGSGMVDFLMAVMKNRTADLEEIEAAINCAEQEMLVNGIVAVGDICNTNHSITQKRRNNLYYHNFIEVSGFVEASAASRFAEAASLYTEFIYTGATSIVPHAPYSVSPALFKLINNFEENALLTMHNQESVAENEFVFSASGDLLKLFASIGVTLAHFKGTGKSSLQSVADFIDPQHQLLLVHNVLTNQSDLDFLKNRTKNIYWCLCVNANQYINNVLPDINLLRNNTSNIVLGTDSLASNNQLNIMKEIETIQQHYPGIELPELLKWATVNGARALGINDVFGSFEKGKRPGVVHLDKGRASRISI